MFNMHGIKILQKSQSSLTYVLDSMVTGRLPKCVTSAFIPARYKHNGNGTKDLASLFQPLDIKPVNNTDDINVGAELSTNFKKDELLKVLSEFYKRPMIKKLASESGLDNQLFHKAYINFRRFCVESDQLPVDLHIILSDILQGAGHFDDIFPYFLSHAKRIFPHLECMDELMKISDLRCPPNWYPEARKVQRTILFHAGPTNSGKTYQALQSFIDSKSGVYCGPLKLLAAEVFNKSNAAGTPCDLVTGEEKQLVHSDGRSSDHVACTVEMTDLNGRYDVAVIDEIQMLRDTQRGWAWTRALLGVCAKEVHVCGEAAAIELIRKFALMTGDNLVVHRYKRLTKLKYSDEAVGSVDNIRPGDCVVCFSKNDIYKITRELEKQNKECAVIYGGLPPGAKLAQAQKFNDPKDSCNIMVATDAIGMGLNLSIKRIIFYSLIRPHLNERGEREMDVISSSQALQIGGRAGRYGTPYAEGEVTTFNERDLNLLKEITSAPVDNVAQAGLHPTPEQIELFAYHLPNATLSNLIDIFVQLCQIDSDRYFMCTIEDFKFLADMIEHIPLPLRVRYMFCCSPISRKQAFVCAMFLKFARQYSRNEPLTHEWLCRQISWPFYMPKSIADLVHLEGVFDVLDLYLWLSYRFEDLVPDANAVREMQRELDSIIQSGVDRITRLLLEASPSFANIDEEEFEMRDRYRKAQMKEAADAPLDTEPNSGKPERLTDRLMREGLLTPKMLRKLQKEWTENDPNLTKS